MVRRLLLTALLAMLAVALPAAAEEDPAFGSSGPDAADCPPLDIACGPAAELGSCDAWDLCALYEPSAVVVVVQPVEGAACRAWELNMPSNNQPLMDTVILDPDGCIRSYIRRTLGWPPMDTLAEPSLSPFTDDVLAWP